MQLFLRHARAVQGALPDLRPDALLQLRRRQHRARRAARTARGLARTAAIVLILLILVFLVLVCIGSVLVDRVRCCQCVRGVRQHCAAVASLGRGMSRFF